MFKARQSQSTIYIIGIYVRSYGSHPGDCGYPIIATTSPLVVSASARTLSAGREPIWQSFCANGATVASLQIRERKQELCPRPTAVTRNRPLLTANF